MIISDQFYMTHEEFMALKIADYETIPYSVSLDCPNNCSSALGLTKPEAPMIGWCETPRGFMIVAECPVCFEKFRYHGTTTERSDIKRFEQVFTEQYWLQNELRKAKS